MLLTLTIAILVVFPVLLGTSYYILGWIVRKCANRKVWNGEVDKDGNRIKIPKPIFWYFQPENTTAYQQRKGNDAAAIGSGSKATPASGSGIIHVTHAVPGMILDRSDPNKMKWHFRKCDGDETEPTLESRKGLFYYLYGVHNLGIFMELRTVKIKEIRLTIDQDKLNKYREDLDKWEKSGKDTPKPAKPRYEEEVKEYETLFPYYSREHSVAVRQAETAGAYTLDFYTNLVYRERFPVRARLKVADPNAKLSEFTEQSINGESGSHDPEYFLFEKATFEDSSGTTPLPSLKERRHTLTETVKKNVAEKALRLIGLAIDEFILYSIDMDEKQRQLLELQEETERKEQARILESEREIKVAENKAKSALAEAKGKADSQKVLNDAEADLVEKVILPIAKQPQGAAVRGAMALEKLTGLTSLTFAPGTNTVIPVGGSTSTK